MTGVDRRSSQNAGYVLLAAWVSVLLAMTPGCSDGEFELTRLVAKKPPTPQPRDDDFLPTAMAALSEGQLTLNNRWTQADLDFENISSPIRYEGRGQPLGRVRSYTTLVQQYRVRRKQCVEDAQTKNQNGEPTCYPVQTNPGVGSPCGADFDDLRYGYYCGGIHPPIGAFRDGTPEPLDGVDYCCRLHDERVWSGGGDTIADKRVDACGILMCLRQASGWPANITARLPDVEEARQCWYDKAATVCPGNQSNDAPPPTFGP